MTAFLFAATTKRHDYLTQVCIVTVGLFPIENKPVGTMENKLFSICADTDNIVRINSSWM